MLKGGVLTYFALHICVSIKINARGAARPGVVRVLCCLVISVVFAVFSRSVASNLGVGGVLIVWAVTVVMGGICLFQVVLAC